MNCSIHISKTKALISFAVTAKQICVFVFAYAKLCFFHDVQCSSLTIELSTCTFFITNKSTSITFTELYSKYIYFRRGIQICSVFYFVSHKIFSKTCNL